MLGIPKNVVKMPPLNKIRAGKKAKVAALDGGPEFQRKLKLMGIREGKVLEVIASHPFGGPTVIKIDSRQTTLGRGIAMKVLVEEL